MSICLRSVEVHYVGSAKVTQFKRVDFITYCNNLAGLIGLFFQSTEHEQEKS